MVLPGEGAARLRPPKSVARERKIPTQMPPPHHLMGLGEGLRGREGRGVSPCPLPSSHGPRPLEGPENIRVGCWGVRGRSREHWMSGKPETEAKCEKPKVPGKGRHTGPSSYPQETLLPTCLQGEPSEACLWEAGVKGPLHPSDVQPHSSLSPQLLTTTFLHLFPFI